MTRPVFGLLVLVFATGVGGFVVSRTDLVEKRSEDYDFEVSKRTFLFGKLVLVPVLATLGLKFLALVPIVLSKIAVLSVMNFLSTNLNLLVSTLFGMKNFLGKHGLWAHETKNHSEWETFDYNQPILQPSLRYSWMTEPLEGRIEKPSKLLKFYNGYGNGYKWAFDRRTRPSDRQQLLPVKEQRSVGGQGKYKCYWTAEGDSPSKQVDLDKNKYDLTNSVVYKSPVYGGQLSSYGNPSNTVDPALKNQIALQSYYDYQPISSSSTAELTDQSGKPEDSSSVSETVTSYVQPQSFSGGDDKEVKSF